LLSALVDLVDSNEDMGTLPAVLLDVKRGAENLGGLLGNVVDDDRAGGYEGEGT
jgi:hypothetical protein